MPPPPPRRLLRLLPRRTKPPALPPPSPPSPSRQQSNAPHPTSDPPSTQLYDRLAAAVLENDGLRRQISAHAAHLESLSLAPLPPPAPLATADSASHSRLPATHHHHQPDTSPLATATRAVSAPLPVIGATALSPAKSDRSDAGKLPNTSDLQDGIKPEPVVGDGKSLGSLAPSCEPPQMPALGDAAASSASLKELGKLNGGGSGEREEAPVGDSGGGDASNGLEEGGRGEEGGSYNQEGSGRVVGLGERRASAESAVQLEAGERVGGVGRKNSVRGVGRAQGREPGGEVTGSRKRSKRSLRGDEHSIGEGASVRSRSLRSVGRDGEGSGDSAKGLDNVSERDWRRENSHAKLRMGEKGAADEHEELDDLGDVGPAVEVQEVEARASMDMDMDDEKDMGPEIWELQVIVEALRGENNRLSMRVEELTRRADTARKRTGEMWGRVERERRGLERAILDVKNENVRLRADIVKLKGREDRVGEMLKGVKKWVEEGLVEFGEVQTPEAGGRTPREWDGEGSYLGVGRGVGGGIGVGVGDGELMKIKQKNRELVRENRILRARAAHLQDENRRMYQDRRVDTDEVLDGIMERVPEREVDMMGQRSHTSDGVDAQGSCVVTFDW